MSQFYTAYDIYFYSLFVDGFGSIYGVVYFFSVQLSGKYFLRIIRYFLVDIHYLQILVTAIGVF